MRGAFLQTSARRDRRARPSSLFLWSSLLSSFSSCCATNHPHFAAWFPTRRKVSSHHSGNHNKKNLLQISNGHHAIMKHKSVVYGPGNQPVWKEQPSPSRRLGEDQVLVRVAAVGLNPVDAKGVVGDKLPHAWTTLQACAQRCFVASKVIGFDFAGTVVECSGDESSQFSPGDAVYGIVPPSRYGGTLQEYMTVSTQQVAKIPHGSVSLTTAAALPLVGITAWQCLQGAGWMSQENDSSASSKTLLVIGASGGTGHVAVQIGRALQPQARIVAVCSTRNKSLVQQLASDLTVLDYRDDTFLQHLQEAGPYDVVMDCVTSGDPRDQATMDYQSLFWPHDARGKPSRSPLLKAHGEYRRLGGAFGDWMRAGVERTTGISLWSNPQAKLFWIQMHNAAPILRQFAIWLQDKTVQGPHVALTVPFTPTGVQEGFDALLGRRVVGKVVVELPSADTDDRTSAAANAAEGNEPSAESENKKDS